MTEQTFLKQAKATFMEYVDGGEAQVFERTIKVAYKILSEAAAHIDNDVSFTSMFLGYAPIYYVLSGQNITKEKFKESVLKVAEISREGDKKQKNAK